MGTLLGRRAGAAAGGRARLPLLIGLIVFLAAAQGGLSWRLERHHRAEGTTRWNVPRSDAMQAIATDFESLLADMFWLQFLQYNGEKLTQDPDKRRYEHLFEGFILMTDLDPRFREVYLFGSWVLGDAGEKDRAIALLERGRARFPDDPWYSYQTAFIEFLYRRDLGRAIAAFAEAERLFGQGPLADPRMRMRSAKLKAYLSERHDQKDLAIRTWRDILRAARKAGDRHMIGIAENALRRLGVKEPPVD